MLSLLLNIRQTRTWFLARYTAYGAHALSLRSFETSRAFVSGPGGTLLTVSLPARAPTQLSSRRPPAIGFRAYRLVRPSTSIEEEQWFMITAPVRAHSSTSKPAYSMSSITFESRQEREYQRGTSVSRYICSRLAKIPLRRTDSKVINLRTSVSTAHIRFFVICGVSLDAQLLIIVTRAMA